jgi:biopolymer transport protein ExbB
VTYLSNLLSEYARNFESGLHVAELQRYRDVLDTATLATENRDLSKQDTYQRQTDLVNASLDRLFNALDGDRFAGTAVDPNGMVQSGTFVVAGPAALFRAEDGLHIGTAEPRLGSLEPTIIGFKTVDDVDAAAQLITTASGDFPLDPTLGNAQKIESTQESLLEHVKKGGPVMIPIFVLAGAALLVALFKWLSLLAVRKPSRKRVDALLSAVAQDDEAAARQAAEHIKGPVGHMLATGVAHLGAPRDLMEEVMYEAMLTTRLRLQHMLPFISICAAAAPLLGLLGTVTGIINTFKLITVFGTGDVKTLSSGISEALITTEYGLLVAIPSLLLHAFLSRKARGVIDQMEQAAIAFANQVSKARQEQLYRHSHNHNHSRTASDAAMQIRDIRDGEAAPAPASQPVLSHDEPRE